MIPWRLRKLASEIKRYLTDKLLSIAVRKVSLPQSLEHRRIILIGASVGLDWRLHLAFPRIKTLHTYQFDKSELVVKAIRSRPDAIIIKECAAYFPGPSVDRNLVQGWVEQIHRAKIRPILATVVPVTREHANRNPGRAEGLWAFNDWIRELARDTKTPLLDLEAALRCSATDRHLRNHLHSGDGLHLSWRTYRQYLDPLIPSMLLKTFAPE